MPPTSRRGNWAKRRPRRCARHSSCSCAETRSLPRVGRIVRAGCLVISRNARPTRPWPGETLGFSCTSRVTTRRSKKQREVVAIAGRVGDRDLVALGLAMQGLVRVRTGDVSDGLALIGEALAGAIAGELGAFATAEIMCEMVTSCLDHADYERAAEWLDTAERGGRHLPSFPGCCRTHRATVLRHRGNWPEAQAQATQARGARRY